MKREKLKRLKTENLEVKKKKLKTTLGFELGLMILFLFIGFYDNREILFGGNMKDLSFDYPFLMGPVMLFGAFYSYSTIKKINDEIRIREVISR